MQQRINSAVDAITAEQISALLRKSWDQNVKPTAVLLDWDDHLIDSAEYYRIAGEHVIQQMTEIYGLPEPEKLYREKGQQKSSEFYWEAYGQMAKTAIEIHHQYLIDPPQKPQLKPGAKELLNFLEINQIPYAIVSDTVQARLESNAKKTLEAEGLTVPLLVGTSTEIFGKPQADGIHKALEILSQKTGQKLEADEAVLFSGDRPDKDGVASVRAGISHIIIPDGKTGDTTGWNTFKDLDTLTAALAKTVDKKLQKPGYFQRFSYQEKNIPRDNTYVIAGEENFIESPATDDPEDGITLTEEEHQFHNLRWIAKRGKHLDGTGSYSQEEKLAAGHLVVDRLLTQSMIDEVAERSFTVAKNKRKNSADQNKPIIIHLPHIGGSKNMLRIALLEQLTTKLNEISQNEYPELNVVFRDANDQAAPIFNVLSIAESLEGEFALDDIEALSGHNVQASLTIKRSTGNLMERMAKQAIFNFNNFQEGDLVVLADDHVQTGSTFITLYQQLVEAGVEVVALMSLATMPESQNLQAHPDVLEDLLQAEKFAIENYMARYPNAHELSMSRSFEQASSDTLSIVGLSKSSLSNREAMTLMASFIDGKQSHQMSWFEGVMEKYGCDPDVVERKGDSLVYQAKQPALTPLSIKNSIQKLIPAFTTRINQTLSL